MSSDTHIAVQGLYDFTATNNDELSFKKGDIITITQQDEGWWEGTLGGTTGWFPSNYVREVKDVSLSSPKQSEAERKEFQAIVLKDLIDSEQAHVAELQAFATNFLYPLEKSTILDDDEFKQLTGNIRDVMDVHKELLQLLEVEQSKPHRDQKVGRLFLNGASKLKNIHQVYCAHHPRAVCIMDKYKDDLTRYMESLGAATPGVLVLITALSKPFRRLDKYSGMLLELERHMDDSHPDRGDTQRSVAVYKDLATSCSALRRQKELELQVLTGPVRGWEGQNLLTLGDIIYMGSVAVGAKHLDRYFVLFPSTLLILSVSHRLSAFIYEGKLPLTGIQVTRLDDSEQYKNAFEITGAMIDKVTAVCQSRDEANHWVDLLQKCNPNTLTTNRPSLSQKVFQAEIVPQTPPHTPLDARGYSTRCSVLRYHAPPSTYRVTPPNQYYPAAAPYYGLSKLYAQHIRAKLITRTLLRQLLYAEYYNSPRFDVRSVRRRRHRSELVIMTSCGGKRDSIINCDSDSDSESDSSDEEDSSSRNSSSIDDKCKSNRLHRQDALAEEDHCIRNKHCVVSASITTSSSDRVSSFGYVRYYNPQTSDIDIVGPQMVSDDRPATKPPSIILTSEARLQLVNQLSETSDVSSIVTQRHIGGGCENLLNLDASFDCGSSNELRVPLSGGQCGNANRTRRSCPTKLVANRFNATSLTTIYIPQCHSNAEIYRYRQDYDHEEMTAILRTSTAPAAQLRSSGATISSASINVSGAFASGSVTCSISTSASTPSISMAAMNNHASVGGASNNPNRRAAWSIYCMRPNPARQPCVALANGVHRLRNQPPTATSYRNDALLLEVIEAYCSLSTGAGGAAGVGGARARMTGTSADDYTKVDAILHKVRRIESMLAQERSARCALQQILRNYLKNNAVDTDNIDWPVTENDAIS